MIAVVGFAAIVTSAAGAIGLAYRGLRGMRDPRRAGAGFLRTPVILTCVGALGAFLILEYSLLTNNFQLEYVANNSSTATPLIYKISSAWAALEGSLVLWSLVLAGYIATMFVAYLRRSADPLWAGALGVMGVIAVFFSVMMITAADPFRVCVQAASVGCVQGVSALGGATVQVAPEGLGPNALLQNHILMAVHPPVLYLGYVGFAVPFAFAMSALSIGRTSVDWLRSSRAWTLVAWAFLTLGIFLGGLWSYEVLGWGGYWAWDPVENASLIPWLVATAFIHSAVVQLRRGMLRLWNFVLVVAAFATTILGTFLTRSGVISSVHSFSQSPVGPALLWFLVVVLVVSLSLLTVRIDRVVSSPRLESVISREGMFLVNNLLLAVFAFAVLVGTLYPLFVEAATGDQLSIGRPFFDRIAIPLSIGLLVAMAICSVVPFRLARSGLIWDRIRTPLLVALALGVASVAIGWTTGWVLLVVVVAAFVVAVAVHRLWAVSSARKRKGGVSSSRAVVSVLRNDSRYWGGQLSHIGVALLALGIALSSNMAVRTVVDLEPGETARFVGLELRHEGTFFRAEPNRDVFGVAIVVTDGGKHERVLEPRMNDYRARDQLVVTPTVATWLRGDLYLSLARIDGESIVLQVFWFPFQWLVWLGATVIAIGPLLGWLGKRRADKPVAVEVS